MEAAFTKYRYERFEVEVLLRIIAGRVIQLLSFGLGLTRVWRRMRMLRLMLRVRGRRGRRVRGRRRGSKDGHRVISGSGSATPAPNPNSLPEPTQIPERGLFCSLIPTPNKERGSTQVIADYNLIYQIIFFIYF